MQKGFKSYSVKDTLEINNFKLLNYQDNTNKQCINVDVKNNNFIKKIIETEKIMINEIILSNEFKDEKLNFHSCGIKVTNDNNNINNIDNNNIDNNNDNIDNNIDNIDNNNDNIDNINNTITLKKKIKYNFNFENFVDDFITLKLKCNKNNMKKELPINNCESKLSLDNLINNYSNNCLENINIFGEIQIIYWFTNNNFNKNYIEIYITLYFTPYEIFLSKQSFLPIMLNTNINKSYINNKLNLTKTEITNNILNIIDTNIKTKIANRKKK
jgi:hypothetical protein